MKIRSVYAGVAIASIALVALGGCGGNGGATGPTVGVTISGAQWVAFQDGKTGSWRTVSTSGGFSGNLTVNSADGRYSLAWVCPGEKPVVNVVHATRSELPNLNATCPSTPSGSEENVNVTVQVQGLPSGSTALTGIGETIFSRSGETKPVRRGTYDVISTRFGAGNIPNKVWIHRGRALNNNTTYTVNFDQPDGTLIRVIDISAGTLNVSGIDTQGGETVSAVLSLEAPTRSTLISVGNTVGQPLSYPIIPLNVLSAGERFRLRLVGNARGEERILSSLPNNIPITLPVPFTNPNFSPNSSGAVSITAIGLSYSETPIQGYQMTIGGGSQQARWQIYISSGWLGNDTQYVSPGVIQTLSGWNNAWSIQRGSSADISLAVAVSPNNTAGEVLNHVLGRPVNPPFTVRFAVRSQTILIR